MAHKGEEKKPVLVRLRLPTYKRLLEESGKQSVRRGVPVSVPLLISEEMDRMVAEQNGTESAEDKSNKG